MGIVPLGRRGKGKRSSPTPEAQTGAGHRGDNTPGRRPGLSPGVYRICTIALGAVRATLTPDYAGTPMNPDVTARSKKRPSSEVDPRTQRS